MGTAAVFIDGGYLAKVLLAYGRPRIDHARFADWACGDNYRFRAYYYDCPPYQSDTPTFDGQRRMDNFRRFIAALHRHPRFTVRLGTLARRDKGHDKSDDPDNDDDKGVHFEQKGVDLQMGLDIANAAMMGRTDTVVIVSGDSDLVPAVD